jgi:sulfite reductase (NADPH) flavoprotein alpha-component
MTKIQHSVPPNAPLNQQKKADLEALLVDLTGNEAAWISGYLAALGQAAGQGGVAAAQPTAGPAPLTILFGSESGNAESCARQAAEAAAQAGFKPVVRDMAECQPVDIAGEKRVLVIVSTWGEGDPPETATDFHAHIMAAGAPALKGLHFAVFALGDSSYADFCECGKQLDRRFGELGAQRVLARADADVDFEAPFAAWLEAVLPAMRTASADAAGSPRVAAGGHMPPAEVPAAPASEAFGKKNPFPAPVKALINLNGRGSAKLTCHVEFSLEGSGLDYAPGDVVGVFPENCPEVVADLLESTGYAPNQEVPAESGDGKPLAEVLQRDFDITSLSASLMKKYAPLAGNKELDGFLEPENKDCLKDWLWGREIRDLFREFPPARQLPVEAFLGLLRKMPPRLYSIASSLRAHPDEVHLTVGAVFYNGYGRARKGVCSTYLCERIQKGDNVRLYTHHNKNFFLPENGDTPVIMIGPGTGIAPFRAFVEERAVLGHKGRNWLFFGDQHFNTDFLYQLEWQDYLRKGVLSRMDVAFSRDTDHKVYVQHRMLEQAADLYAWMQEGAFFYVCGDANRMAKDVHQALIQIYSEQGGVSIEAAEVAVKELQKSKRYQRDVY